MPIHPLKVLDRAIAEYREYLLTEFRAKDPKLRAALEREIDSPLFLAQEPFFQAHRPFKNGAKWTDLPLDPKLARAMVKRSGVDTAYLHQSSAIAHLLGAQASPLVVTTGTGSGKTECFLLPVLQNALDDAARFRKPGLTAILVYPMNALANDQEERIKELLRESGFEEAVQVAKYDRGTPESVREELRQNPPHILLTNYMMLEYLLTRPKDREGIFANHRCRFLVLDEVHTYRGTLGTNIALLVRRLQAHLRRARQDWGTDVGEADRPRRFPALIPVGTSATIKSGEEGGTPPERAVQNFFSILTGARPETVMVLCEKLEEIPVPPQARYAAKPAAGQSLDVNDQEQVRRAVCALAGIPENRDLGEACRAARILWDLGSWLARKPMSVSEIVERIRREVPERREAAPAEIRAEVELALVAGAALPDGAPGALRLRCHRFLRGGWRFHRCISPDCGRLYPMGEGHCECGHKTAPLYLCRNCGADYLRFSGEPGHAPLAPYADAPETKEWLLYEPGRHEEPLADDESDDDDDGDRRGRVNPNRPTQVGNRPVLEGSFDPEGLNFSDNPKDYPLHVFLTPRRTRCLCCGGTAGSRSILTPVSLGTSAAVKVVGEGLVEALAEANAGKEGHDGKERLLVFSDSRQDAAHQARFIQFAGRYDRMRRRVFRLLRERGPLGIEDLVVQLGHEGIEKRDNPYAPNDPEAWIPDEEQQRIRVWEEAPLLDELSLSASYRATLFNLGLVGADYHRLDEYIEQKGKELAGRLGVSASQLGHICRAILDEMRRRGALNRPMLRYHPSHDACPSHFRAANWERKIKTPHGYAADKSGNPVANLDPHQVAEGIALDNPWRRPGGRGRPPSLQRILAHLLGRFGAPAPDDALMVELLEFLRKGSFIKPEKLYGYRKEQVLLQVNAEAIRLVMLDERTRLRCNVCTAPQPLRIVGGPCFRCHGNLAVWKDAEIAENRTVRRIGGEKALPLFAGEHTAQVPGEARLALEQNFKAGTEQSPVNVLACSPTLEMGIDVGGLDAIILRNVPPRPDNYAQRGGRAGRRSRVGLIVGYTRRTPHDQYFYERPAEMISGEIPVPPVSLSNQDVIKRHLAAVAFGAAEPGLSGRMLDYVTPTGELKTEDIDKLVDGVASKAAWAVELCQEAWGRDIFQSAGLDDVALRTYLAGLPERIRDLFNRVARQVRELRQALENYAATVKGKHAGTRAADLIGRLLGIREGKEERYEADDRSAGYPMRRFAEFGILPGYEFPTEPASLRLLGDEREEDPIVVVRRFGIAQFQPDAIVHARGGRWKVIGLDGSSPWNPRGDVPGWPYRLCRACRLRYNAQEPRCPRCKSDSMGRDLPGYEFAGFLAKRDEAPILDEEDRIPARNLIQCHPQWNGEVIGRWLTTPGWPMTLRRSEEVRWVNEGYDLTPGERKRGVLSLHEDAAGWPLCAACGALLVNIQPSDTDAGRRKTARSDAGKDPYGHRKECPRSGTPPVPCAIQTVTVGQVLRILAPIPMDRARDDIDSWGLSLGCALRIGLRRHFMLDGSEIEFELEGPWEAGQNEQRCRWISLTFIDPSLGGSGFLERGASELHLVARLALDHLRHDRCETACYRCLKSYTNQRYHDRLSWPQIVSSLEALAEAPPASQPLQKGEIHDPGPWLEAYKAGVGSPLELKFLRLFESHGFHPQKQFPISLVPGSPAISIADFAVPERRLAIYVDGASVHVGANLRRDRFIRRRLQEAVPPWQVVELRASDLGQGRDLVERLKG